MQQTHDGYDSAEDAAEEHGQQQPTGDTGYRKPAEPIVLCTTDDTSWKAERRKRVTASDILCFLGMEPNWWSSSWEEILQHKLTGTDRQMDLDGRVNVAHGIRSEALNLEITQELLGFPVTRHSAFYVNQRWSHLGASLDGLLWTTRGLGPNLDLSTQTGLVAETYERLAALPGPIMVESKNARYPFKRRDGGFSSWLGGAGAPDYYIPQVQMGLHIADFEWGLLCARLGGRDMAPHLIQRDPKWADILDKANDRAIVELGRLW